MTPLIKILFTSCARYMAHHESTRNRTCCSGVLRGHTVLAHPEDEMPIAGKKRSIDDPWPERCEPV